MGVDIATYRGRIGTFSHNFGLDVVTVVCHVQFDRLLKCIGSLAFIGVLLIIAGVEQNPGPNDKEEHPMYLSVLTKALPIFVEKLELDTVLVNLLTEGIITVNQLTDIKGKSTISDQVSALVSEIGKSGANAYKVFKTTLQKSSREDLIAYLEEFETEFTHTVRDDINANTSSLSATGGELSQAEKMKQSIIQTWNHTLLKRRKDFWNKLKNHNTAEQYKQWREKTPIILPQKLQMHAIKDETEPQRRRRERHILDNFIAEHELLQLTADSHEAHYKAINEDMMELFNTKFTRVQTCAKQLPAMTDEFDLGSDTCNELHVSDKFQKTQGQVPVSRNVAELERIINLLGLAEQIKAKIKISDAIKIDFIEDSETLEYQDIPFRFLQSFLSGNSDAMDYESYNVIKRSKPETKGSVHAMYQRQESGKISPLDLFLLVFQCCDPMLKQLLFQKLYICKTAFPLIYKEYPSAKSTMSVWPLRSLVIETIHDTSSSRNEITECSLIDLPVNVVSFARFGRPTFSKSKLLNGLLSNKGCETFFHKDRPLGTCRRYSTMGYVDMFVLPVLSDRNNLFNQPIMFLNLRGGMTEDFDEPVFDFISKVSDVIAIMVDSNVFLEYNTPLKKTIKHFANVLLIFNGQLGSPDGETCRILKKFEHEVLKDSKTMLRIISTHSQTDEMNYTDIITETRETLFELLCSETVVSESLQERISNTSIQTDESESCNEAYKSASFIIQSMVNVSSQELLVEHVTPIQNTTTKTLSALLKESYRSKDVSSLSKIKTKMSSLRDLNENQITLTIKLFSNCLVTHMKDISYLHYVLSWMKILLERQKRFHSSKKKTLRFSGGASSLAHNLENTDGNNLEIGHLFREIGHICDSAISSKTNPSQIGFPSILHLAEVVANLVADGYTIELFDGNSFWIPTEWIKLVLGLVHELIGKKKVLALSVLGIQSSGKSTLLNTMFGLQFPTSSGRCTKGIHIQLIPIRRKNISALNQTFEFALLIDTEGVRAPELADTHGTCYSRDNELSTLITGLGDITMINVMGESTSEMRDILQILTHAFLRLKLANKKLDIQKSCFFIHQAVSDMQASANMESGLRIAVINLDKATEEAANFENIRGITTFSEVIEFDPQSHVWYLPNFWQGYPPMASVNQKYCKMAVKLRNHLVNKSINTQGKSFKTLADTLLHIDDLWKGVLAENFVFSFRNSIEKKANLDLEQKIKDEQWSIECSFDDKIFQMAQIKFSQCDDVSSLRKIKKEVILEMKLVIANCRSETLEKMETFFIENNYKDIIIQWKVQSMKRIRVFCDEVIDNRRPEIDRLSAAREVDIMITIMCKKHEEDLRRKSVQLEKELMLLGKEINKEEADKWFEQIWITFIEESVSVGYSLDFEPENSLKDDFIDYLNDRYKSHENILSSYLNDSNYLEKNLEIKILSGSFEKIGININDFSIKSKLNKGHEHYSKKEFKRGMEAVENVFLSVDLKVKQICQRNTKIAYRDIRQFLNEVCNLMTSIQNDNACTLDMTGILKAVVHISCYSYFRFKEENYAHQKTQSVQVRLEMYKKQVRERFFAHLMDRKAEETAASLMRRTIEDCIHVNLKEMLQLKVRKALRDKLPVLKGELLLEILTDLVQKNSFHHFMRYILSPKEYATVWISEKAKHILFSDNSRMYEKLAEIEISKYLKDVETSLARSTEHFQGYTSSIKQWIQHFISLLTTLKLPKESFREVERELEQIEQVHVLDFKNKVVEEIQSSGTTLLHEFKMTTGDTVKWSSFNPIETLSRMMWGCPESCLFCGEPCILDFEHNVRTNHRCMQHRPLGCCGLFDDTNGMILLNSCHQGIAGNADVPCSVINFRCNPFTREPCPKERHLIRHYTEYAPDWYIESYSYTDETFWSWFIGNYDKELGEYYRVNVTNVPDWWKNISEEEALLSLQTFYHIYCRHTERISLLETIL